jgi:drug/metabolite transporter (DMT)-like permease
MKARVVWLILCCIWGSTWLFIKIGLTDLPPMTFAGIRFVLASLILTLMVLARRARWPRTRKEWTLIATVGVLQFALNYGLVFWGEQYISSGLAAVLQSTFPAFGLVFAHFYLPHERITPGRVMGVLLGVFGVAVIFSDQLSIAGHMALLGSVALVLSALCGSYGNVLVKAYGATIDPQAMAAGQMVFGLVPLLTIGVVTEGNPMHLRWTTTAIIALLYLVVIGSVVAFALYYWLVRNMDVTNTMLISLVTPPVAVVLGMIVLHEKLNWRLLAGGACIISGLALIVFRKRAGRVSQGEEEIDPISVG